MVPPTITTDAKYSLIVGVPCTISISYLFFSIYPKEGQPHNGKDVWSYQISDSRLCGKTHPSHTSTRSLSLLLCLHREPAQYLFCVGELQWGIQRREAPQDKTAVFLFYSHLDPDYTPSREDTTPMLTATL